MLVIRKSQMDAMGETLQSRHAAEFDDLVLRDLSENHPEVFAAMGEPDARDFVNRVKRLALQYRIGSPGPLATLMDLMFEYGEQFEFSPDGAWARSVLDHATLPDHLKVTLINDRFAKRSGGRRMVRVAAVRSGRARASGAAG